MVPGKATLSGALRASPVTADSIALLRRATEYAAADVGNLEHANRLGDLSRALGLRSLVHDFVAQAPALLAAIPRDGDAGLTANAHALLKRARLALDNAPQISDAAREAAARRDYARWNADLAPWLAKANRSADPEPAIGTAAPALHLGSGQVPAKTETPASLTEASPLMEDDHVVAARGTEGSGGQLPHLEAIQKSFGRHDVSAVRAHVGGEAANASRALGAQAFAYGNSVAFASAPDLHTAAHEAAHVVQQRAGVHLKGGVGAASDAYERHADAVADRVVAGRSAEPLLADLPSGSAAPARAAAIQRKEVGTVAEITGPHDWTRTDRETNSTRWQAACLHNLQAVDSSQFVKIVERRDFYKWFYEYSVKLGLTTRWALAASLVADGAHEIADMDQDHDWANDILGMANVELQGAMREGNQVIFDNVLPKLKKLIEDPNMRERNRKGRSPKRDDPSLAWDKQTLSEEQTLVQPLYDRMSSQSFNQLNYIARKKRFAGVGVWLTGGDKVEKGPFNNKDRVPAFDQSDMRSVDDRWRYGMELGNKFTPGGTGFDPAVDTRPPEPAGYRDGTELAKVDTLRHLHQLDAWLSPNRMSRGGSGIKLHSIIDGLTQREKEIVLRDRSADGWAYSTQFAQFRFITEAQVRRALPSEPAAAVSAFISRYFVERDRVQDEVDRSTMPPWL